MSFKDPEVALRELLAGSPFEIYRLGIGGYNTLQESLYLANHVPQDFDIVILGFCLNDFMPSMAVVSNSQDNKQEYKMVKNLFEPIGKVDPFWWTHSALYRWIQLQRIKRDLQTETWTIDEIRKNRNPVQEALRQIHHLVKSRGGELHVILYPHLVENPDAYLLAAYQTAQVILQELQISWTDPGERIRAAGFQNMKIQADDITHPNSRAHRLAFEQMMEQRPELFRH
jgi:hypothetical protein